MMPYVITFVGVIGLYLSIAGILFGAAGSTAWPWCWAYLAIMLVLSLSVVVAVYRRIPEMLQEQRRANVREQDKLTHPLFLILLITHWLLAGLDVGRYHWLDQVPITLQVLALIVFSGGFSLLAWSVTVNRFYSPRVNIQTERAQEVITTGPYRLVRHPGYSGWILCMLSSGLALGSWLAMLPMLLLAADIVRRTIIEDQMLQEQLKGYTDYARCVRYRLIPGLW